MFETKKNGQKHTKNINIEKIKQEMTKSMKNTKIIVWKYVDYVAICIYFMFLAMKFA